MEYNEIVEMIDRQAAVRRDADSEHLRQLGDTMNAGLGQWCTRMRRIRTVAMTLLLILLPSALYISLPQREPTMVACNIDGGESEVIDCARNLISIA